MIMTSRPRALSDRTLAALGDSLTLVHEEDLVGPIGRMGRSGQSRGRQADVRRPPTVE